jgi:hypothetical protein
MARSKVLERMMRREFRKNALKEVPFLRRLKEFGVRKFALYADLNRPREGEPAYEDDQDRQAQLIREWLTNSTGAKHSNAVFLDNTTLHTAHRLLNGEGPRTITPTMLLDLANFSNALVLYDKIFVLENSQCTADCAAFNQCMGENIVTPIPVHSADPKFREAAGSLLTSHWIQGREYFDNILSRHDNTGDFASINAAWEAMLGIEIDLKKYTEANQNIGKQYSDSDPPTFVSIVLEPDPRMGGDICNIVAESNRRCLLNYGIAYALDLQYLPNSFRMPFQQMLLNNGLATRDALAAFLNQRWREQVSGYLGKQEGLTLPVFLTAALARADNVKNVRDSLAHFRVHAAGFRKHRAEYETAIIEGDHEKLDEMLNALRAEESNLRTLVASIGLIAITFGAIAVVEDAHPSVSTAVVTGSAYAAATAAALAPKVVTDVIKAITDAAAENTFEILGKSGLLRIRMRFLSSAAGTARAMMKALPRVKSLWHVESKDEDFTTMYRRLAALESKNVSFKSL